MHRPSKQELREKYLKKRNGGDLSPLKLTHRTLEDEGLVPALVNFVSAHPAFSRKIFDVHGSVHGLGSRLGRGEVLVYFLFDDVALGGSSSNHDVIIGGNPALEIKCARRTGESYRSFMLGIDEVPASLNYFYRCLRLFEKADRHGHLPLPQNFANISKSKLESLRGLYPQALQKAEERYYHQLFNGPVGQKKYLFFDYDTALPIFFGKLGPRNLKIDRISGGLTRLSFKP